MSGHSKWHSIRHKKAKVDAAKGKASGVKSLTQILMQVGATIEEILEALRVSYFVSGVGCIYTSAEAFRELF